MASPLLGGLSHLLQYHSVRHLEHLLVASCPHRAQVEGSRNSSPKLLTHLEEDGELVSEQNNSKLSLFDP